MSVRCPAGHDSVAVDYCDECGAPIEATASAPALVESLDDSTTVTVVDRCPSCGWIRMPGDRFCEQCRLDFSSVTVSPDATVTTGGNAESKNPQWQCSGRHETV